MFFIRICNEHLDFDSEECKNSSSYNNETGK